MKKIFTRRCTSIFILIFGSTLFASSNLFAQTKAQVKTLTEYTVEPRGGKNTELKKHYQQYDTHGNLADEINYGADGKMTEELKYEYNSQNQKVKEIHFTPQGKMDEIATYEYDAKGNKISKNTTDGSGKLKSKKKWTYEYY